MAMAGRGVELLFVVMIPNGMLAKLKCERDGIETHDFKTDMMGNCIENSK